MKAGERECLDEVKKDGKEKRQRKSVNSNERDACIIIVKISVDTREAYDIIETITATKRCRTAWGVAIFATAVRLRQYRRILSADTASEVRQMPSQKRR